MIHVLNMEKHINLLVVIKIVDLIVEYAFSA